MAWLVISQRSITSLQETGEEEVTGAIIPDTGRVEGGLYNTVEPSMVTKCTVYVCTRLEEYGITKHQF